MSVLVGYVSTPEGEAALQMGVTEVGRDRLEPIAIKVTAQRCRVERYVAFLRRRSERADEAAEGIGSGQDWWYRQPVVLADDTRQ